MNVPEFMDIVEEFRAHEEELLAAKRAAYAGDADCLSNFKQIAGILGLVPEQVCSVYLLKHILGIAREVDAGGKAVWGDAASEGLNQRISDARNYLVLLAAIIRERDDDGQ